LAAADTFAQTGAGGTVGKIIEAAGRRSDGQEFPIEISLAPVKLNGLWWAVATVRDITERKEAEAGLRRYNDELVVAKMELERRTLELTEQAKDLEHARSTAEAASRAKSAFLATISHELRTPMNSIIGFTGHLVERLDGKIEASELDALRTVQRNADDLLTIINRVLLVARFEAGNMQVRRSRFDVWSVVRGAVNQLAPLAERKGLQLNMHPPRAATQVDADPTMTAQIVSNLVSNAIKYTKRGCVSVAASESEDAEIGAAVCIRVADTGKGIKPDDRARLFEMFTQLDPCTTRTGSGTGLGLYIASRYIQMLGGRIEVTSQWGSGSTFTVFLPRAADTPPRVCGGGEHEDSAATIVPAEPAPSGGQGVGLLCLTDDPGLLESMGPRLMTAGYTVMAIEDFDTAVEPGWAQAPDVVFLDLGIPGRDAPEIIRTLRRGGALSQVPVVIMPVGRDEGAEVPLSLLCHLTTAREPGEWARAVREVVPDDLSSVLIVSHDAELGQDVERALSDRDVAIERTAGVHDAVAQLGHTVPSVIILDSRLPPQDGNELLDRLRRQANGRSSRLLLLLAPQTTARQLARFQSAAAPFVSIGETTTIDLVKTLLQETSARGCSLKETSS
jgi:signal transduction histidine kinase/DNA-binding response OmpR family regulator